MDLILTVLTFHIRKSTDIFLIPSIQSNSRRFDFIHPLKTKSILHYIVMLFELINNDVNIDVMEVYFVKQ